MKIREIRGNNYQDAACSCYALLRVSMAPKSAEWSTYPANEKRPSTLGCRGLVDLTIPMTGALVTAASTTTITVDRLSIVSAVVASVDGLLINRLAIDRLLINWLAVGRLLIVASSTTETAAIINLSLIHI